MRKLWYGLLRVNVGKLSDYRIFCLNEWNQNVYIFFNGKHDRPLANSLFVNENTCKAVYLSMDFLYEVNYRTRVNNLLNRQTDRQVDRHTDSRHGTYHSQVFTIACTIPFVIS